MTLFLVSPMHGNVNLAEFTDLTVEQLQERARQIASSDRPGDADPRQELLEVYGLFASEYDYRPVDVKTIPHGDFAHEFGRTRTKRLLLNYGAMQSLEKLLDLVHDDGFILINDYGQTQISRDDDGRNGTAPALDRLLSVHTPPGERWRRDPNYPISPIYPDL